MLFRIRRATPRRAVLEYLTHLEWAAAGADLRHVDFSDANLTYGRFYRADLRGARFHQTDLEGSDFTEALLEGAVFYNNALSAAKFFTRSKHTRTTQKNPHAGMSMSKPQGLLEDQEAYLQSLGVLKDL